MRDISVIIVSWNAREHLKNCLESVRKTGGTQVREIIVVDNASTDGSPEMVTEQYPEVVLVQSSENLGFARATNLGMQRATGSLLALVNSDVIIDPDCLRRLAACLEEYEDAGLVGPRVRGRDGSIQMTCRRLPTIWNTACRMPSLDRALSGWPLLSPLQMWYWNIEHRMTVEVLGGCFWLARRRAVEEVGGLDERFFFYSEDVDWCKRFRDAGWKILFVPEAGATHFGGGSSSNAPLRYSIEILRSNLMYWRKHHGISGRSVFYLIAIVHHGLRFVARGFLRMTGLADDESRNKLQEHIVCLRWLLTGKGV
jgi:hypothetical protein